jgi:hypothetical protein
MISNKPLKHFLGQDLSRWDGQVFRDSEPAKRLRNHEQDLPAKPTGFDLQELRTNLVEEIQRRHPE